ncbi:polysaccharide deacetylase family protein [Streptomyces sp. YIM B13518]|uniref:polysaccharide deacetylase family protein n=1 Tax=Streptomyces sp. YIM B13518 TaxID=3366316 RepID=UPI0036C1A39D
MGAGGRCARLPDVLKEERVPATFFLPGRRHIERCPEPVRRTAGEGHEVADRTWAHHRPTEPEPDGTREELERTTEETARLTGRRPAPMRPPRGRTDDTVHRVGREPGLSEVLRARPRRTARRPAPPSSPVASSTGPRATASSCSTASATARRRPSPASSPGRRGGAACS